ncbi:MAG: histidinol dehydrogenase [Dehalococcoidia bacterium]|nr:MAG: histidinol dehydrogenase [Dehalococcoidia bacterium]
MKEFTLKVIRDLEVAKSTLLKRLPLELQEIPPGLKQRIKEAFAEELTPQQVVEQILAEVRSEGDAALFDYTRRLDGVELTNLEVKREEIAQSYAEVSQELASALNLAAQRIQAFHLNYKRQSWVDFGQGGRGQWFRPLERVGIYIPGGTAYYPSTLLMTAIPARVAGVREIILTIPPREGAIPPAILLAADIAQVDRVFNIGGAQAIAALAFGTQSIPKVDKICGPGNIFVQLAKKMVYGMVGIDGLYGPTETIILADETANAVICAADLLAQAEHDPLASAILITTSSELAARVNQEIENQLIRLERREIAATSLENKGGIIIVTDVDQAVELINDYAPEHLSLMMRDAWSYLEKIKNAGGVFIGEDSPEAMGDYTAGPSHVMPTGGTARFNSPLTINDFLKVTSVIAIDSQTLKVIGPAAAIIAQAEGFSGHAHAVEIRLAKGRKNKN